MYRPWPGMPVTHVHGGTLVSILYVSIYYSTIGVALYTKLYRSLDLFSGTIAYIHNRQNQLT